MKTQTNTTKQVIELDGLFCVETRFNDGYTRPMYSKDFKSRRGAEKHLETLKSFE